MKPLDLCDYAMADITQDIDLIDVRSVETD